MNASPKKRWNGNVGWQSEYQLLRSDFELSHKQAVLVIEYGWGAIPVPQKRDATVNYFRLAGVLA